MCVQNAEIFEPWGAQGDTSPYHSKGIQIVSSAARMTAGRSWPTPLRNFIRLAAVVIRTAASKGQETQLQLYRVLIAQPFSQFDFASRVLVSAFGTVGMLNAFMTRPRGRFLLTIISRAVRHAGARAAALPSGNVAHTEPVRIS
jgi:hypothetical protein